MRREVVSLSFAAAMGGCGNDSAEVGPVVGRWDESAHCSASPEPGFPDCEWCWSVYLEVFDDLSAAATRGESPGVCLEYESGRAYWEGEVTPLGEMGDGWHYKIDLGDLNLSCTLAPNAEELTCAIDGGRVQESMWNFTRD